MRLFTNIRTLYTPEGTTAKRGREAMRAIRTIHDAAILVDGRGRIAHVGERQMVLRSPEVAKAERIDCGGLVALPGLVDSHTHAVFAGERSSEFGARAAGSSYQEIAAAGGGIASSVKQVREASEDAIVAHSQRYLERALALGTTTIEVKSGYGLDTASELKLLRAAGALAEIVPIEIVRTYLGAHAIPRGADRNDYVDEICNEQIPAVVKEHAAEFIDVFCDKGYFTNEETARIIRAGLTAGLKPRLHVDELADTSGAELAVELGVYSADHLLNVSDRGIAALAAGNTIATLLPTTALSLRAEYAPARKLIDSGAAVAIATDCNPGSSMSENMQFVMTLAVIGMQMSVEEALTAATLNGAAALGRAETHGSIEPDKWMDVVLYDIPQLAYLPYHIAVSDVVAVVKRGQVVSGSLREHSR